MVAKLFERRPPAREDVLLDPGCGAGAFIQGVIRWCRTTNAPVPRIIGIELNPALLKQARAELGHVPGVELRQGDFLEPSEERFDYIVGNPPYVPITGLTVEERSGYRQRYRSAVGRFDLYLLFFEQALALLKPNGRLVFVTPEKFLYVQSAANLRRSLAARGVEEIQLIDEDAFRPLVTYPTVTTLGGSAGSMETVVRFRNGTVSRVHLSRSGASWLPLAVGEASRPAGPVLSEAFRRISCGVATGADSVFLVRESEIPAALRPFALPTLSGRDLRPGGGIETTQLLLTPYERTGSLLLEEELGPLGDYLRHPERRAKLLQRTCVARKPWYAFHENPPLVDILKPKILCKDIGASPYFVLDDHGVVVPRHSVYYLVPTDPARLVDLCDYLNSDCSRQWLLANCQRAANGFVRLQSHVLKRMPVPPELVDIPELVYA